jgi:hypothetical protein
MPLAESFWLLVLGRRVGHMSSAISIGPIRFGPLTVVTERWELKAHRVVTGQQGSDAKVGIQLSGSSPPLSQYEGAQSFRHGA